MLLGLVWRYPYLHSRCLLPPNPRWERPSIFPFIVLVHHREFFLLLCWKLDVGGLSWMVHVGVGDDCSGCLLNGFMLMPSVA